MAKDKNTYIPQDEKELVAEVQSGNKQAWEYIIKCYYDPLLNYITAMVKDREAAEELIQDVFVNFWVKRERLNITISLKAYLYRAAKNHTLNFIKRRNFEFNYQRGLAQTITTSNNDTEDTFRFSELEKMLNKAIEDLPENCKEIFMLSRFENLTYKEISEALDIPVRTVHYQIGLALKDLRKKLAGHVDPSLMSVTTLLLCLSFMI